MSDAQFAALAMGAHPYKVCQLHWHSTDYRPLLAKMGIDWQKAWDEFERDVELLRRGEKEYMTWDDVDTPVPSKSIALAERGFTPDRFDH